MTISEALPVQFWDIDDETFNEKAVCSIDRACFCQPFNASDEIAVRFTDSAHNAYTVCLYNENGSLIEDIQATEISSNAWDASFVPAQLSPEITGKIQIKILANGLTPVKKSDCINIQASHDCTTKITYSNSKTFASITYGPQSPDPSFSIRIPAIFFQERFPDEHEEIDLSNSRIVRLTNQLKAQKLLDIGFMPFYMHKKLQLILMHDTITIDGDSWIRTEPYELTESNKRYPLRKAQVWLTDKNYIVRNIL